MNLSLQSKGVFSVLIMFYTSVVLRGSVKLGGCEYVCIKKVPSCLAQCLFRFVYGFPTALQELLELQADAAYIVTSIPSVPK